MLSLILTILKIAGIVLVSIIGLAILLICIILFVPVRYRAVGYYKKDYKITGQISWLLHFISVKVVYENNNPFKIVVKILGIPVFDNLRSHLKNKDSDEPESMPKGRKKIRIGKKNNEENEDSAPALPDNGDEEMEPYAHPEIKISSVDNDTLSNNVTQKEKSDVVIEGDAKQYDLQEEKKIKNSLFDKIASFIRKIIQFIQNIKYTFLHLCDIIKNIRSNITYYCNVLKQEETKLAWQACKKQLFSIWNNLKPKKYNVNLHIGMEDPANMGQILGIWGMLYPLHEGNISIEPEFDHYVFEGEFNVRGRITVYIYLWAAYTILYNKNIRHFRKCLSREEN